MHQTLHTPRTGPEFLRGAMRRNIRTLERAFRQAGALLQESAVLPDGAGESAAATWLLENQSYLRSQVREVAESLSRRYCRELARASESGRKPTGDPPRIYRIVLEALHRHTGALTTKALAGHFQPECLGVSLILAELWAIPAMVKLVLLEELATAVQGGQLDSLACKNAIADAIQRLRSADRIRWRDLVESVSVVERILRDDPSGIYSKMTFESRDLYRKAAEKIAAETGSNEETVARVAMTLAREAAGRNRDTRTAHVGYYLIGPGVHRLERRGGFSRNRRARIRQRLLEMPDFLYIGGTLACTAALMYALWLLLGPFPAWWVALFSIPLIQTAVTLVNLGINLSLGPRRLPRMDFSKGIPQEYRTCVAVPTLLLSRSGVAKLLRQLEIHYLANRDPNLGFALLTDFADSAHPPAKQDPLLKQCVRGIRRLNRKHGLGETGPFYLFHRAQHWNESEGVWMGRERKRGKLEDFNRFLLGESDAFEAKVGDLNALGAIRYVITLDTDTQLPRDTAWRLAGTLAHPLHEAILDPDTGIVRDGYAILQPRVSISMESAAASRLAGVYSGETGLDPYATAISNVYQDLYGKATYTGKGIYDLRAFHDSLDGRFPENMLLSHDLIEGEHARVGLVTDIDIIEDYPRTYESHSKRKHRWVRGDWQILDWLLPRVPAGGAKIIQNPLPPVSRWKIFDNLRRSTFEISLLAALLLGTAFVAGASGRIVMAVLAALLVPAYAELAAAALHHPPMRFWRCYLRERIAEFGRAHVEAFLTLSFLLHQSLLMADAIIRTLSRRFITKRKLLEWESMAQSEAKGPAKFQLATCYLLACPVVTAIVAVAWTGEIALPLFAVMSLWIGSPLLAQFVNAKPSRRREEGPSEVEFLRDLALRTWRYFADFSLPSAHWLVPDNIQLDPEKVTHQTSPTNMGLQLTSIVAAGDFGYLTHRELAGRLGDVLDTLGCLERYRGHFYNWYDTRTLETLPPRFVSLVDSGNLAAALVALKQTCADMSRQPLAGTKLLEGLRDHCLRLRNALPGSLRGMAIMTRIAALTRLLECRPTNLLFWKGTLADVAATVRDLNAHIDWACEFLEARKPHSAAEVRYWQRTLNERVEAAIEELCALAPWLSRPFEAEIRARVANTAFEELIEAVSRVPSLGELASAYDAVGNAARRLLEKPQALGEKFCGLLRHLASEIDAARGRSANLLEAFTSHSRTASRWALEMDFKFLLDRDRDLLRIGYNAETGQLEESYYDLLASEARTAVFFAVAKGDAPREVWFSLGRKITSFRGCRTLISWSGTMFEYLMPALFMKTFAPTLLCEAMNGAVRIQQTYARDHGIPWGISESACGTRDIGLRYRYRAFGVPAVSLRRASAPQSSLVVAPYASALALLVDRRAAAENLRSMAFRGWTGRYGFFESIDFRAGFATAGREPTVVRSFMAHHQGMTLAALCNTLLDNVMQTRFHSDPLIAAAERLLQERIPAAFAPAEEEQQVTPVRDRLGATMPSFETES